jgi:ketosteroid isomerase-like protein
LEAWELEAREAIRDLVARYNANGDAGRIAQMMQLFADDAVLSVGERTHRGAAEIREMFERAAADTRGRSGGLVRHFTATHQIDLIDPARARGRCYFQTLTEAGLDHWGRYLDEYARAGDRWLFAAREVRVDGRAPGSWAERRERG